MKITPQTTLGELAVELGKHGIEDIRVGIAPGALLMPYRVLVRTHDVVCKGDGKTLAEAIDDALVRVIHLGGAEILEGRVP